MAAPGEQPGQHPTGDHGLRFPVPAQATSRVEAGSGSGPSATIPQAPVQFTCTPATDRWRFAARINPGQDAGPVERWQTKPLCGGSFWPRFIRSLPQLILGLCVPSGYPLAEARAT